MYSYPSIYANTCEGICTIDIHTYVHKDAYNKHILIEIVLKEVALRGGSSFWSKRTRAVPNWVHTSCLIAVCPCIQAPKWETFTYIHTYIESHHLAFHLAFYFSFRGKYLELNLRPGEPGRDGSGWCT